jgi:ribosomal protein S18 acetylase RimI-like enzyme
VKVRLATPDDAEPIATVHIASWRAAYRGLVPDSLLDSLDVAERSRIWAHVLATEESRCYVAIEQGQIIGFIHVCACRDSDQDPGSTGEITSIYLAPEHWRRGHGTVLLRRGMDALKARGVSSVVLWVFEGNGSARAFYEALDFNPDAARKIHAMSGRVQMRYATDLDPSRHA